MTTVKNSIKCTRKLILHRLTALADIPLPTQHRKVHNFIRILPTSEIW